MIRSRMRNGFSKLSRKRTTEMLGRFAVTLFVGLTLASCASEAVHLKNQAGNIVQCGPYNDRGIGPIADLATQQRLRDCVTDFQRQGYERLATP